MSRLESPLHPLPRALFLALREAGVRQVRLLLALSGGADSTALLRSALECSTALHLELCAAHLNHGLRGEDSRADAVWLVSLCRSLNVPLVVGELDVASFAEEGGLGIEEAARQSRYEFLDRVACEQKCPVLAVAHSADDAAETVLHNLLRGTGLAGLKGIPRERTLPLGTRLVRPLLNATRREIVDYLNGLPQDFRNDASNAVLEATRNRLRHDLLPKLRSEFNPQIDRILGQLAQQAEAVHEAVSYAARELAARWREPTAEADWAIRWQELQKHPRHLLREMFVSIWTDMGWPRQEMTFVHWNRLAEQIFTGGRVQFPKGIEAVRSGRLLLLRRSSGIEPPGSMNPSGA